MGSVESQLPTLRAYAHCARSGKGGVALLLLNMDNSSAVEVNTTGMSLAQMGPRDEYHLSSKSLDSQDMYLNGDHLVPGDDGSIPELKPKRADAGEPLLLEALTYAFVLLGEAGATVCEDGFMVHV